MPMIEVLISTDRPLTRERKAAFAAEAERILGEVLGTPKGRMRLFVIELPAENASDVLLAEDSPAERKSLGPQD